MKKNHMFKYKHLFIYIITIIIIVLLGWYGYSWYQVISKEKLKTSYLISTNTVSLTLENVNEIDTVLKETPNSFYVLISYKNDVDTYKLEKKLKSIIDDNELRDNFYYLDVTNIKEDSNIIKKLNKAFNTDKINTIPCILVYDDDKLVDILKNDDKIIVNLQNLLKKN